MNRGLEISSAAADSCARPCWTRCRPGCRCGWPCSTGCWPGALKRWSYERAPDQGARLLGGRSWSDVLVEDGCHRRDAAGGSVDRRTSSTRRRARAAARARRPAHPPARAGTRGRRDDRESGSARGGARWVHRRARHGQHRPGGRHRRDRRAGVAARSDGRAGRRPAGRRRVARPGRRDAGRDRHDGAQLGGGDGVQRRRPVRARRPADAPGAGVRQAVRRRRRPARAGSAPGRSRGLRARGRDVVAGSGWPAGPRSPRNRSSPATSCSAGTPARGCTSATCPAARTVEVTPLGQGPRHRRHRRGHPAPPAAHLRPARGPTTRSSR